MFFALGCYTRMGGPGVGIMEEKDGAFRLVCTSDAVKDPTWVMQSPHDPHILYAGANLDGKGGVASLLWEGETLSLLSLQPTGGGSCCHLTVDKEEKYLYAASYRDGTVSVLPLDQGKIGPVLQALPYSAPLGPVADRQDCSHAHQCVFRPGTKELFVCNLGTDQVVVYHKKADGTLEVKYAIPGKAGTGPRHLLFDGPDRFYLAGELIGWLSMYEFENGAWHCRCTLPTVPKGYETVNTAAAIYKDEGHIYVSNRGHDSIAKFSLSENGMPALEKLIHTPGACPRDFMLWENGFLLAQQEKGGVAFMDEKGVPGPSLPYTGVVRICPLKET